MRDVLHQLKIRGRNDTKANVFQLLRYWLGDITHGPWLVILDNADDAGVLLRSPSPSEQAGTPPGNALIDYIPRCDHGKVLVTSRTKGTAKELVYPKGIIAVGPMNEEQAAALLRKKLNTTHTEQHALQLARELECMPLALTQAAAYICQSDGRCSIQRYLEKLGQCDKSEASVLDINERDLRRDRESSNSIMLTWQISFNHIRETKPSAADLLSLISFFDRQAIPEALLHIQGSGEAERGGSIGEETNRAVTRAGGERRDRDHHIPERRAGTEGDASVVAAEKAEELEKDLVVLRNYYFVSLSTDAKMFEMHRLVQLATKKWLKASGQLERWGSQSIYNLNEVFPDGRFENWELCRSLYPHAMAALHTEMKGQKAVLWQAWLFLRSGRYALTIGAYTDAERMLEQSFKARSNVLGEWHLDTLTSMNSLASAYARQGRQEKAEMLFLEVIEKRKNVLGRDHPNTLTSTAHLADTYFHRGRYDEAAELQAEVMKSKKIVLGERHPDTLTSVHNLALTYSQQGNLAEAEHLQAEVLEKRKRVLGEHHPDTLMGMSNLAGTYLKQGQLVKAEELQVEAIKREKEMLGDSHPNTLASQSKLAWIYMKQGRWEETEQQQVEVIAKRKATIGEGHPDTLASTATLAYMLRALGRRKSALNLMGSCAQKSPDVLGVDHYNAKEYWRVKTQWEREDGSVAGAEAVCGTSDEPAFGGAKLTRTLRNAFAMRFR